MVNSKNSHGPRSRQFPAAGLPLPLVAQPAGASGEESAAPGVPRFRPGASRDEIVEHTLAPYRGSHTPGVSAETFKGKVICGYQGWFAAPGDGSGRGWRHYGRDGVFAPGACTIDLWPDVAELSPVERFATAFRRADGRPAEAFSSLNAATVDRHFRWMRDYGIDGAFVQRFGVELGSPAGLHHANVVLSHCRAGANRNGRVWAVLYDLSGLDRGAVQSVANDWTQLVDRMRVGRDPGDRAYLRHGGKPFVAVWGVGFNDGRRYALDECAALVEFLKHDPTYGGNAVMLGVPAYWRTLSRDCVADEQLHAIVAAADVVSPWSVGRYDSADAVDRFAREVWQGDLDWCRRREVDYLPVVFPGFSWHNMNPQAPLNQIPRRGGRFLWQQFTALRQLGVASAYQAMFDEMDEGTAIFKCTNDPPVGASPFVTYEGLPSDHYLWLAGQGARLLRGEIEPTPELPLRGE